MHGACPYAKQNRRYDFIAEFLEATLNSAKYIDVDVNDIMRTVSRFRWRTVVVFLTGVSAPYPAQHPHIVGLSAEPGELKCFQSLRSKLCARLRIHA